ncbi:MAG: SET domain-containing protein-lysine N-methyltransferase [Rhabdochlamydiaceae bacterium]|nr:SET domain-containing protein-lysine N-methyltransferase [Rhabdochlamydiaceae bacterium]
MVPKLWPNGLTYARESTAAEMPLCLLQTFLSTGNSEDLEKISWVIEERRVIPQVQIREITPLFTIDGQKSHPLCHQKTLRGNTHRGIFATQEIKMGTQIGEYVGEIYLVNDQSSLRDLFARVPNSSYAWVIKKDHLFLIIDAQNIANETALINDFQGIGPAPNVRIRPLIHKGTLHFGYVAVCDIPKGKELLAGYGKHFTL